MKLPRFPDLQSPTPTPPSTSQATRALTAIHGSEDWIDTANEAGADIAAGSPQPAIESLSRKAIVLDALFFKTIEDAAKAPIGKLAALIREARGLERDQRLIREEIDKLRRRIVTPAAEH